MVTLVGLKAFLSIFNTKMLKHQCTLYDGDGESYHFNKNPEKQTDTFLCRVIFKELKTSVLFRELKFGRIYLTCFD